MSVVLSIGCQNVAKLRASQSGIAESVPVAIVCLEDAQKMPHPCSAIETNRDYARAVRKEGDRRDRIYVSSETCILLEGKRIPNSRAAVGRPEGDETVVWREHRGVYVTVMFTDSKLFECLAIPTHV
jgi:hypothetical protein